MKKDKRVFQVYINNKPYQKFFKVASLETAYNQFNKWCKDERNCSSFETREGVLGNMVWLNGSLSFEIREVKLEK